MSSPHRPLLRANFEIAIICALPLEFDAVASLFDRFWDERGDPYGKAAGDPNQYTTGQIGKHNVVLVLLPSMGEINAAGAAASVRFSYTGLRLALLVGICGGVPKTGEDDGKELLLGDVVISRNVIQYDFGSQYPDRLKRKNTLEDVLGRPNKDIRSLLIILETERGFERLRRRMAYHLEALQAHIDPKIRKKYLYPGIAEDKLFEPTYRHKHHESLSCICSQCENKSDPVCDEALRSSCADLQCDERYLVSRRRLGTREQQGQRENSDDQLPVIHIGRIASGNAVMKSGEDRDRIAREARAIAFEMEGAGVWDEVPCVVIKGVCDYADSHKNKKWQDFAAATAASTMKAFLECYSQTTASMPIASLESEDSLLMYHDHDHVSPQVERDDQRLITDHMTLEADQVTKRNHSNKICGISRKLVLVLILVIAIIILAAVLGSIFGTRHSSKSNTPSPTPLPTTTQAGILANSKLATTNWTDSNNYIHRAVFYQHSSNALMLSLWDSQNTTWNIINVTQSVSQSVGQVSITVMSGTPLAAAAAYSIASFQMNLYYLSPQNALGELYTNDPIGGNWFIGRLMSEEVFAEAGSQLAAYWRQAPAQGYYESILVVYVQSGNLVLLNSTDWTLRTTVASHVISGSGISISPLIGDNGLRIYYGISNDLQEAVGGDTPDNSWVSGTTLARGLPDSGPLSVASVGFGSDSDPELLVALLNDNGTVTAYWLNTSWTTGHNPTLNPSSVYNFSYIAMDQSMRFYGIATDGIKEFSIDNSNPLSWTLVDIVKTPNSTIH